MKIECISKFKGEINNKFQKVYVGKDIEGNLYKSYDVLSLEKTIWVPLSKSEHLIPQSHLYELPFNIGSKEDDKLKKAGIKVISFNIPEVENTKGMDRGISI